jgi:hypothetical protein
MHRLESEGDRMVQAKTRFTSIKAYAALDTSDLPEGRYELVESSLLQKSQTAIPGIQGKSVTPGS